MIYILYYIILYNNETHAAHNRRENRLKSDFDVSEYVYAQASVFRLRPISLARK